MKRIVLLLALVSAMNAISAQTMNLKKSQFDEAYSSYKEQKLQHRRFKHQDIVPLIEQHQLKGKLDVKVIGHSVQNRSIYELTYGQGAKKVMLWSQMHGDEPTATMALFDLFNFLEAEHDGFDSVRTLLREKLDLHFIPMLNPDGTEVYSRRNAQKIDLNRDARDTATPEGKILHSRAAAVKPQFAFNLHDQNIYYNVPGTKTPVAISLLAPAYNWAREINEVRGNAMKIIVGMKEILKDYIPGALAKYDDEHSPRAFGDSFQKWGASTILIESGAYAGDAEKQEIRKLNFILILNALIQIAQDDFQKYQIADYHTIPFNASQLHDVVLRDVATIAQHLPLKVDIAIRRDEITIGKDYAVRGYVEDMGDLEDFYGYTDIDLAGYEYLQPKVYDQVFPNLASLDSLDIKKLLQEGFAAIRVEETEKGKLHNYPIQVLTSSTFPNATNLALGQEANFFLKKDGQIRYALINGYFIDLQQELPRTLKQIIK